MSKRRKKLNTVLTKNHELLMTEVHGYRYSATANNMKGAISLHLRTLAEPDCIDITRARIAGTKHYELYNVTRSCISLFGSYVIKDYIQGDRLEEKLFCSL